MRCPFCGESDSKVLDSRPAEDKESIRRRRECGHCVRRFTTYERIELLPVTVAKKDGRREPFLRGKCLAGILKACEKRPVPREKIETIVNEIEQELQVSYGREVSSRVIGEMVTERLRLLDQVAYVRFASVYREFRDLHTFMTELQLLLQAAPEKVERG